MSDKNAKLRKEGSDIMIVKILNIFGILLIMIGTIFSLWQIISTEQSFVGTAKDWDTKQEQFKKEKRCVIIGMVLIVFGSLLQIAA